MDNIEEKDDKGKDDEGKEIEKQEEKKAVREKRGEEEQRERKEQEEEQKTPNEVIDTETSTETSTETAQTESTEAIEPMDVETAEKLIEATLFMTSKPLSIYDLLRLTNAALRTVKTAIKNLQMDYDGRKSWIEVVRIERSYLMRLRPQYTDRISGFAQEIELSKKALRVLGVVANNDGILQSKIVKSIGPSVYEGVAELEKKGYIVSEIKSHSKILRISKKFRDYFGEIAVG